MAIKFFELTDVTSKDFDKAISIYIDSFPATERHNVDVIRERVANRKERMFIGQSDNEIVMMALIWSLKNTKFVLFDYLAVKEESRNLGIGSSFVKNIFQICQIKNKAFVLEVHDPQVGEDREVRKQRVQFYRRNGAKEMKNVKYILPPLHGNFPTQMFLVMLISPSTETWLSGKRVKKLFEQIYRELYSRNEDDPLLNSFINLVPAKVEIV